MTDLSTQVTYFRLEMEKFARNIIESSLFLSPVIPAGQEIFDELHEKVSRKDINISMFDRFESALIAVETELAKQLEDGATWEGEDQQWKRRLSRAFPGSNVAGASSLASSQSTLSHSQNANRSPSQSVANPSAWPTTTHSTTNQQPSQWTATTSSRSQTRANSGGDENREKLSAGLARVESPERPPTAMIRSSSALQLHTRVDSSSNNSSAKAESPAPCSASNSNNPSPSKETTQKDVPTLSIVRPTKAANESAGGGGTGKSEPKRLPETPTKSAASATMGELDREKQAQAERPPIRQVVSSPTLSANVLHQQTGEKPVQQRDEKSPEKAPSSTASASIAPTALATIPAHGSQQKSSLNIGQRGRVSREPTQAELKEKERDGGMERAMSPSRREYHSAPKKRPDDSAPVQILMSPMLSKSDKQRGEGRKKFNLNANEEDSSESGNEREGNPDEEANNDEQFDEMNRKFRPVNVNQIAQIENLHFNEQFNRDKSMSAINTTTASSTTTAAQNSNNNTAATATTQAPNGLDRQFTGEIKVRTRGKQLEPLMVNVPPTNSTTTNAPNASLSVPSHREFEAGISQSNSNPAPNKVLGMRRVVSSPSLHEKVSHGDRARRRDAVTVYDVVAAAEAQVPLALPAGTIQQMKRFVNEPLNRPLTAFPDHLTTDADRVELLCTAAYEGDNVSVANLVNSPVGENHDILNGRDNRGHTPLHCACRQGNLECVLVLLNARGILVNEKSTETGATPLHITCAHGHCAIAACLLAMGASQKLKNYAEALPMDETLSIELLELLEKFNADGINYLIVNYPVVQRLNRIQEHIHNRTSLVVDSTEERKKLEQEARLKLFRIGVSKRLLSNVSKALEEVPGRYMGKPFGAKHEKIEDLKGWLNKVNVEKNLFKKYYFTIENENLCYYFDENMTDQKGIIYLPNYDLVQILDQARRYSFVLTNFNYNKANPKDVVLNVSTNQEMMRWVDAMTYTISRYRTMKDNLSPERIETTVQLVISELTFSEQATNDKNLVKDTIIVIYANKSEMGRTKSLNLVDKKKIVENFFEFNVDSRVREIVIFIYQKRKRDRMAKMNKLMKYCFSFPIESIQREPMIDALVPFGIPIQGKFCFSWFSHEQPDLNLVTKRNIRLKIPNAVHDCYKTIHFCVHSTTNLVGEIYIKIFYGMQFFETPVGEKGKNNTITWNHPEGFLINLNQTLKWPILIQFWRRKIHVGLDNCDAMVFELELAPDDKVFEIENNGKDNSIELEQYPSEGNKYMEVFGKIRVSASAKQKYILSNNCYNEVFRLFCINNMQLLKLFGTVVKQNEKLIADLFIRAFSNKGNIVDMLTEAVDFQIKATTNHEILFRENTFSVYLVESFLRIEGLDYLHYCLKDIVLKIYNTHQLKSCEIDQVRIIAQLGGELRDEKKVQRTLEKNTANLVKYCEMIFDRILNSLAFCPQQIKLVFGFLQSEVASHYPEDEKARYTAVTGFIWLRYFCVALLQPIAYQLLSSSNVQQPLPAAFYRDLTFIAKTLQKLANLALFESGTIMDRLNPWLQSKHEKMKEWINALCQGKRNNDYELEKSWTRTMESIVANLEISMGALQDTYKDNVNIDNLSLALMSMRDKVGNMKRNELLLEMKMKQFFGQRDVEDERKFAMQMQQTMPLFLQPISDEGKDPDATSLAVVASSHQQNSPPKLSLKDSISMNKNAKQTLMRLALNQSLPQAPLHPLNYTGTLSLSSESLNILKQRGSLKNKSLAVNKGSDRESLFHIFSFLQEESELEEENVDGGEQKVSELTGEQNPSEDSLVKSQEMNLAKMINDSYSQRYKQLNQGKKVRSPLTLSQMQMLIHQTPLPDTPPDPDATSKSTPRMEVDTLSRKNESPSHGLSLEEGSRVGDQGDEGSPAITPSLASLNSSLGSGVNSVADSPVQSDSGVEYSFNLSNIDVKRIVAPMLPVLPVRTSSLTSEVSDRDEYSVSYTSELGNNYNRNTNSNKSLTKSKSLPSVPTSSVISSKSSSQQTNNKNNTSNSALTKSAIYNAPPHHARSVSTASHSMTQSHSNFFVTASSSQAAKEHHSVSGGQATVQLNPSATLISPLQPTLSQSSSVTVSLAPLNNNVSNTSASNTHNASHSISDAKKRGDATTEDLEEGANMSSSYTPVISGSTANLNLKFGK